MAFTREEALHLLSSVAYGRIVFSQGALPAITPVNHLVDDTGIILRTHLGTALLPSTRPTVVVAYEADIIDPARRRGWSVIVTGYTERVSDPEEAASYRRRLHSWVEGEPDEVVRVHPELVTGFPLFADGGTEPDDARGDGEGALDGHHMARCASDDGPDHPPQPA